MAYKTAHELIVNGDNQLSYIHKNDKVQFINELTDHFNSFIRSSGHIVKTSSPHGHPLSQAVDKASFYANLLALLNWDKFLFVSNFNAGNPNWMDENGIVKWSIVAQLIPIMYRKWYAPEDFHPYILRPRESKHRGVIHHLYEQYYPKNAIIDGGPQYKVGRTPDGALYDRDSFRTDCVVFLDTDAESPMSFTDFVNQFRRYLITARSTTGIVDINHSYPPRIAATVNSIEEEAAQVFSIRAQWDDAARINGRPEDFKAMIDSTTVYTV